MKKFILSVTLSLFLTGLVYAGSKTTPNSNLYGWYILGGVWTKLTVNELAELIVRCSTQSTVKIIDNDVIQVVEVDTAENDEEETTWYGLWTNSRLYGFLEDTDSWSRLRLNEIYDLIVRCSTQSTVKIIDESQDQAEVFNGNNDDAAAIWYGLLTQSYNYGFNALTGGWDRLRVDELDNLWVRTSTNSKVQIIDTDQDVAEVDTGENDGEAPAQEGLVTNSRLYGYYDEDQADEWNRLRVDELTNLWVRTSTNSITQARNYFWDGAAWAMGISNELGQQIVETSTKSHTQIIDADLDEAIIEPANADGLNAELLGLLTLGFNYGFNGTTWDRLLSDINHHLWVRLSTNSHVIVDGITCDSDTAHVTVYPGAGQVFDVSESSVITRYQIIDSTYVCRNFYATGSLTVNFNVKCIKAYSQGGTTQLRWDTGDYVPIWDGIPFDETPIDETFDENVTFNFTLAVPTTFSIYIRGIE